ncbi:hypothetical protein D9M70_245580 [compost metagenome]
MILAEKGSQPKALDQPLPMVEPDANQHAQCTHLGILVGRRPCLKDLGPVGQLMQCAATAEEALHDLVDLTDPRPLIDTAVMIGLQILGELIGLHWPPSECSWPTTSQPTPRSTPGRFAARYSSTRVCDDFGTDPTPASLLVAGGRVQTEPRHSAPCAHEPASFSHCPVFAVSGSERLFPRLQGLDRMLPTAVEKRIAPLLNSRPVPSRTRRWEPPNLPVAWIRRRRFAFLASIRGGAHGWQRGSDHLEWRRCDPDIACARSPYGDPPH